MACSWYRSTLAAHKERIVLSFKQALASASSSSPSHARQPASAPVVSLRPSQ